MGESRNEPKDLRYEWANVTNPLERRSSIGRSPTRRASVSSQSSCDPKYDEEKTAYGKKEKGQQTYKRKRKNNTPEKEQEGNMEINTIIKNSINNVLHFAKELEQTLSDMYKPKTELTEISSKLLFQAEKLRSEPITKWLEEASESKKNDKNQKLLTENKKLLVELETLKKGRHIVDGDPPTLNSNISCADCKKAQRAHKRRQELKGEENYSNFLKTTEEDWEAELFSNPNVKQGHIWDAPNECDIILPCNKDIMSSYKEVGRAITKYGGREELKRQNKENGEVGMMLHSLGFPDDKGNLTQVSKWLFYPIISDKTKNCDEEDKKLLRPYRKLKTTWLNIKGTK